MYKRNMQWKSIIWNAEILINYALYDKHINEIAFFKNVDFA